MSHKIEKEMRAFYRNEHKLNKKVLEMNEFKLSNYRSLYSPEDIKRMEAENERLARHIKNYEGS